MAARGRAQRSGLSFPIMHEGRHAAARSRAKGCEEEGVPPLVMSAVDADERDASR